MILTATNMSLKPADSAATRLTALVQRVDPAARLLDIRPLHGGISAATTALQLVDGSGRRRRWIVRCLSPHTLQRNPRAAEDQFRTLQILQTIGTRTPVPIHLEPSGELFTTPCLVLEYIDGQPDYNPANVVDFAAQAARQLAEIHQVNGCDFDLDFLPDQTARLATLLDYPPPQADTARDEGRIHAALAPVWPVPNVNTAVLLHGDFWPGNWLWSDGRLTAIIDWEDAARGDPLSDLAISRLDMHLIFGSAARAAFTQAYQTANPIDFSQLPYWDLYAALRAAWGIPEWAGGWPALGRPDITAQTLHRRHLAFVNQTLASLPGQSKR